MSESQEIEEIGPLTIREKLNMPYLLARQIITVQQSILSEENSEREIQESVNGLVELVPDAWKDDQFRKDLENAKTIQRIDKRPLVAGNIRITEETCKELGIIPFEEKKVVDYYKVFQACIDLLCRRDLISKKRRIEKLVELDLDNITENEILESDLSS